MASAEHANYVGSQRCVACHVEEARAWRTSHHALAERELSAHLDGVAFRDGIPVVDAPPGSGVAVEAGAGLLLSRGSNGTVGRHRVERAIGVEPLVQYLVQSAGGRWQVSELAYDPAKSEWFHVFGQEQREPHEWGHWTGRGMNWNAQCADCHTTDLIKGYSAAEDNYSTSWSELGVGCEACHGPGAAHVEAYEAGGVNGQKPALFTGSSAPERVLELCGTCHSRRTELQERFVPGEPLLDAFLPELPGLSEVYYADGQVREENYEYTSFLLSALHAGGVNCIHCHDPHTARPRAEGNALCLGCHTQAVSQRVPAIDPTAHSHHDPTGPGAQCIACHMPLTTYMQRDPRHDHSFGIPDPLLTLELGIPNACNKCHSEQSTGWALAAVEDWYGADFNSAQRRRARVLARARQGVRNVEHELLEWLKVERSPAWRAVLADVCASYAALPAVYEALQQLAREESELVRAYAARSLEGALPASQALLLQLTADSVRAVRATAAFALRGTKAQSAAQALRDLESWEAHNLDQPVGRLFAAERALASGDAGRAVKQLELATAWDPLSAPLFSSLAVAQSMLGQADAALAAAQRASLLAPQDAAVWYSLGLARYATQDAEGARAAFEEAVRLNPEFARAYYNLGLLCGEMRDGECADRAFETATTLEPQNGDTWFAWAAVLRDLGQNDKARWATEQAQNISGDSARAQALLESLR